MEIDRGDDGDGDTHTGQAPRDRAIPSFASIPPLSPSMEESEDRLDDSRSTNKAAQSVLQMDLKYTIDNTKGL
jgi:hypothetical protein